MNELKEGTKNDSQKVRMDLVPWESVVYLAQVYTFGAVKYEDRNWEKGIRFSRVYAAVLRHLTAFWMRENRDRESRLHHLAHAMWGCASLLFFMLKYDQYKKYDDRPEGYMAMEVEHILK